MKHNLLSVCTTFVCLFLLSTQAYASTPIPTTNNTTQVQRGIGTHNGNVEYSEYKILEANEAKVLNSTCLGDYHPILPASQTLNTNIYSSEVYSPQSKENDWIIIDHIGSKDAAFSGERHIAKRDNNSSYGLQWFGYEQNPNNDAMFKDIGEWTRLNVQQCPVRADWHTVNGSGIIFNLTTNAPTGEYKAVYKQAYEGSSNTMSFYAFVVTVNTVELREYKDVTFSAFSDGTAKYSVLQSIGKECNSQSLTIEHIGNLYKFYIGNNLCFEPQTLNSYGTYSGVMVDYKLHNCTSLSSVYMFNFTVDGDNLFKLEEDNTPISDTTPNNTIK